MDVWGPTPVKSLGGARYFVTFVDDYSRMCWVYLMKEKSQVFEIFKEWKAKVELQTGKELKCVRSDNGGEYRSNEFDKFGSDLGLKRYYTVPDTPE